MRFERSLWGGAVFSAAAVCIAVFFAAAMASAASAAERETIPLWKDGAPGEPATKPQDEPVLLMSKPEAQVAAGSAVIIIPGGSYAGLAMDHEGTQIADWMNSLGVTAVILKYRVISTRFPCSTVSARYEPFVLGPTNGTSILRRSALLVSRPVGTWPARWVRISMRATPRRLI
jgi:acetyl esterase/lipase